MLVMATGQTLNGASSSGFATPLAMLRPEHLVRVERNESPPTDALIMQGVLKEIVTVGSHTTLFVESGDQSLSARHIGMPHDDLQPGDRITLAARRDHVHLIADAT